ncbi:MAG TPA: cytochrome c [Vicinamibacterales bacterium]|nr:cytochrome c [Vicinamibacterales bacterium]
MRRTAAAILTIIVAVTAGGTVRSDDPVSSSLTFNREIVRVLERKCFQCHGPGSVAMPLASYRDARAWSRAIREELVEGRMPPWGAAPGYTPLAHDGALTLREMAMLLTWLDGGMPRGDDRDLPAPPPTPAPDDAPDLLLQLPPQDVPAEADHVVRRVTVAADPSTRRIARLELRPGERRVLRAALITIETLTGSTWTGAWTPWQASFSPPDGAAFDLPPDARLQVELHYRGRDTAITDRSAIALYSAAASAVPVRQVTIPTRESARGRGSSPRRTGSARLEAAARLWALVPSGTSVPAASGSLEVVARRPDGSTQVLLWIPEYRQEWPSPYLLKTPMDLPKGTLVSVTATGAPVHQVALSILTAGAIAESSATARAR